MDTVRLYPFDPLARRQDVRLPAGSRILNAVRDELEGKVAKLVVCVSASQRREDVYVVYTFSEEVSPDLPLHRYINTLFTEGGEPRHVFVD